MVPSLSRPALIATLLAGCLMAQPMPADVSPADILADETERDKREKLDEIAAALGIREGSVVADIGTGYGYYAVRFSRRVGPQGRVIAQEIDKPLIGKLRARIQSEGLANVEPVLGTPSDPGLERYRFDAILIADVYHEVDDPVRFLRRLRDSLKPEGRLMVIDYLKPEMQSKSRETQRKEHNLGPGFVEQDLREAGFVILGRKDPLGPGYDGIPMYSILAKSR